MGNTGHWELQLRLEMIGKCAGKGRCTVSKKTDSNFTCESNYGPENKDNKGGLNVLCCAK
jgi:hypothetical protein